MSDKPKSTPFSIAGTAQGKEWEATGGNYEGGRFFLTAFRFRPTNGPWQRWIKDHTGSFDNVEEVRSHVQQQVEGIVDNT